MRSRRKRDMARTIVAIRDVQKLLAEQARAAADREVALQETGTRDASDKFEQARLQWGNHLDSGRLLPEFMTALATEVIDREKTYEAARRTLRSAQRELDARTRGVEVSAGLQEQAEQVLRRARRDIAIQEQERAQTELEERTAYQWSRS